MLQYYGPVRASAHRASTHTPRPCIGLGLLQAAATVRDVEDHHITSSHALSGTCTGAWSQQPASGEGGM